MADAIAFRKKIVVNPNRPLAPQIGKAQRGQWLFVSGMNARLLNQVGGNIVVVRHDRKERKSEVLTYV